MVDLPSFDLSRLQSEWLAEARARLLRLARIAHRKTVLELGAGFGVVSAELQRRCGGSVVALDLNHQALSQSPVTSVCANAGKLPFRGSCFDLLFSQNFLLWARPAETIVKEARRVLNDRGVWVLMEPDYGGMIEYPPEIQTVEIWISALGRAGADPFIGRKLSELLTAHNFLVRTEFLQRPENPRPERYDFLLELPLTPAERSAIMKMKERTMPSPAGEVAHLPYFLLIAERS